MSACTRTRIYALILFTLALGALAIYATDHDVRMSLAEWVAVLAGTFGLSRVIAREKVCDPIRQMCCRIGLAELVECPRCVGAWAAFALVAGVLFVPSYAVLVGGLFGVVGINIALHEMLGVLVRYSQRLDIHNSNMQSANPMYKVEIL